MPYPQDQMYVRMEFSMAGTEEVQDTGFWAQVEGASGVDFDWQDFCDKVAAKVRDDWIAQYTIKTDFSPFVQGARVVAYHYDQAHLNVLTRGEAAFDATHAWKGTGSALPPQNALVVSLYGYDPTLFVADRARKRGRMYLPTPGATSLDTKGMVTSAAQAAYMSQFAGWWAAIQGNITTDLGDVASIQPVIASRAGQFTTDAKWVRIGNVVDTQRRRRNHLTETYVTNNVP